MDKIQKIIFYISGVFLFLIFFIRLFLSAPANFPVGTIIKIAPGMSLRGVSLELKQEHIISSRLAFEAFVIIFGKERVVASDYYLETKLPVYEVARRIVKGEHHIAPVVVTIPEGFDNTQIADTFASRLINFDKNKFLLLAQNLQGYLFPDTYFFLSTDDEADVFSSMSQNFQKKITPILSQISASGHSEKDIIIMASLIEREAKGDVGGQTDRGFISGILWKRIKLGMPLQVDSATETYKKKGLPKNPISNPGLAAINAAIYPQSSPYLYYLHDKAGMIHYAETFAQHEANIKKYLTQ